MITETHARTITKAVIYRIISVIAIMMITLAFGGTIEQEMSVGAIVIVLGTAIY